MKATAYAKLSFEVPTNKNAAAPGGVQRNARVDSACLKSNGASWPATAALKPATAPINAITVSPRARLRRSSDPIVVDSHLERAMPKRIVGIAVKRANTKLPV